MTPSGIEPATFRFVAQCLKHCATACLNIPDIDYFSNTVLKRKKLYTSCVVGAFLEGQAFTALPVLYLYSAEIELQSVWKAAVVD
jgi:hypothetical protein